MVSQWDCNVEGVVIELSDGSRWKVKAESYIKVHRLLSRLAFKRILQAVRDESMDDILPLLPKHIYKAVMEVINDINSIFHQTKHKVMIFFENRPTDLCTRKEFAIWATTYYKDIAHYLFRLYDGQPLDKDIFQHEFHHYKGRLALPESLDID